MPHTNRATRLAYAKRWKAANRERYLRGVKKANAKAKAGLQAYLIRVKAESACIECGEDHPACLDFHHRDPATKFFPVSNAPTRKVSIARLQKEIDKCDILCSNCHRKLHAGVAKW